MNNIEDDNVSKTENLRLQKIQNDLDKYILKKN